MNKLQGILTGICCVVATGTSCYAQTNNPPALPLGANDWTTLYATFDHDLHAGQAKENPYSAGSGVGIVPGGLIGNAIQGSSKLSTLVYAGSNLPREKGTIRIYVKNTNPENIFSDGKEYFLATAERNLPVRYGSPEEMEEYPGFNFLLYKNAANELVFSLNNNTYSYIRLRGQPGGFPDEKVSVRLPCDGLAPSGWHEIVISWDVPAHKFWLRLNGQLATGEMPANFRAGEFIDLQLTNHRDIWTPRQGAFPGLIDELLVSDHSLPEWMKGAPGTAIRQEAPEPDWPRSQARLFQDEPFKTYEAQLRTALDTQARFQNQSGGWTLSISYPSGMAFTSGKMRTSMPPNLYGNSKDGTSTLAALRYAMAYEVLGDGKYLEVAKRAAESVLKAQQETGYWCYSWTITDGKVTPETPERAAIEDHVQSGPILLLLYLNRLTGEQRYLDAARKGIDFLIQAQNPDGSWSHHFNTVKKIGETANGQLGGGELNDFTTTGTMKVMLLGYRMTGEQRFLDSYLKGAGWILAAFIDKSATGGAVGWAQQYNAKLKPISARQFEPVGVENFASGMAASALLETYRMTGESKYLQPVQRWVNWLQSKGPEYNWYHDIETGRPIAAQNHKVYFLDDPAQAAGYKAAFEATGQPYDIAGFHRLKDWVNIGEFAQKLQAIDKVSFSPSSVSQKDAKERPAPTRQEIEKQLETGLTATQELSTRFNWKMGTFRPTAGTPGLRFGTGSREWVPIMWTLVRAGALRGLVPYSHPLLHMPMVSETGQEIEIVASHLDLYTPLSIQRGIVSAKVQQP